MIAPLLASILLFPAGPSTIAPSLTVDLDGDGTKESVTAESARGFVRLQVRDAAGRKLADAKAPSPAGEIVPLALTSGPLGSAGALVEVVAATDAMECRTFWRYRDGALASLPLRDAAGKTVPACSLPAGWTARWEAASGGRSAAWLRERTETAAGGPLEVREAYAFAGFSLDFDAARSATRIAGVPIPAWYAATLYSRAALEILYSRFRLEGMRAEPTLSIEADRRSGVFALRFAGPRGELVAPVDTYALSSEGATLGARAGDRTVRARVQFARGGTVPLTVVVEGLGPDWDRSYSPAGAWRGGARRVFPEAADELAAQGLSGVMVRRARTSQAVRDRRRAALSSPVRRGRVDARARRRDCAVRRVAASGRPVRGPRLGARPPGREPHRSRPRRLLGRASPPAMPHRRRARDAPAPGCPDQRAIEVDGRGTAL